MKNPRAVLMIVVSIAVAIAAVLLASQWVKDKTKVATNQVVVARSDINLGTRLTPQMLKVADWPSNSVPEGSASDPEKLKDRVVKTSLLSGEPVLESKLAPVGTTGGLSAVIGEGKRAMTVRVNDVVGVAGFALPGNYVDIVVNTEDESTKSDRNKSISKIVLEHILVLAVAQESSRDETKPKVVNAVTLEVTPEQAEKLDLARSVGQLSLVLRNQMDTSAVTTTGTTKKDMLNRKEELLAMPIAATQPEAKAEVKTVVKKVYVTRKAPEKKQPAKEEAPKEQVEVIKGVEKSTQAF
ncbi:pilus assembly protein CpaB [Novimethylophilus kurashikiensis]|uniref:Pilus assembly protein CpaB n=1 Tax=Novimethylophilus kurashikiensis TaxID=1825523 RepID=A0A2R5F3V5_9PROT|nr:Flp pilus assembly protein CpaB [Novimethylophilus kurashikiensis]GBG13150.1 pilus assembly protein CpaB [Novimethylophilus kurashikiensis]